LPSPYASPLSIETVHETHAVDDDALETLLRHVLDAEESRLRHLSVVLADHETVRRLNRDYLDHDYDTDVLSFSLTGADDDAVEGEVYVDLDTASERHDEFDVSFEHEVYRYAVHGLLHLIGYDDADDAQQSEMRALEDEYLAHAFDA